MKLEEVERQMVRRERYRFGQVSLPAVARLVRESRDEVQAHLVEPRTPKHRDGRPRRSRIVNAANRSKLRVVERLHANTGAGHAGGSVRIELRRVDRARVHLDGDFGVRRDHERRANDVEHAGQIPRRQQRRCPTTEEDRIDGWPAVGLAGKANLSFERGKIASRERLVEVARHERAVRTLRPAERDVNVDSREYGHGIVIVTKRRSIFEPARRATDNVSWSPDGKRLDQIVEVRLAADLLLVCRDDDASLAKALGRRERARFDVRNVGARDALEETVARKVRRDRPRRDAEAGAVVRSDVRMPRRELIVVVEVVAVSTHGCLKAFASVGELRRRRPGCRISDVRQPNHGSGRERSDSPDQIAAILDSSRR